MSTYLIPADLKRTELPDGEWIVVRGVDKSAPRILFRYTGPDDTVQETWMALGETVEVLGRRVLRFETIEFAGSASQWMVTIREVGPDTPPYERPTSGRQTWHPAELRPFGTLDEAAVRGFEQRIGTELPRSYREWLTANNGAAPTQDVTVGGLPFCLNEIHPLLGLRPDAPHLDLSFGESRRPPWLTDEYLIIAVPLGGLLAVKIRGLYTDQIVFLPGPAMQAAPPLVPVAQSMRAFCVNLQPMPPVTPGGLAGR